MTYTTVINQAPVVLVEFYASWCPHCRHMVPVVDHVKELLGDKIPVIQLDIDENKDAADEAEVETIPTFLIYRNGREEWRHSGEIDRDDLLAKAQSFI